MGGMALAIQWSDRPTVVQADSIGALSTLTDGSLSRSAYGHLVAEVKRLMEDREFVPIKVSRSQNRVAHALANYGRSEHSNRLWVHQEPYFISNLVLADCNSITGE
ncbi:unnamed protein product [Alopecurus aequalis]